MGEDLESDELAEVFGKECKSGVRVVGSHISKKQLIQLGWQGQKLNEKARINEDAALLEEKILSYIDSRMDSFEGLIMPLVSNLPNVSSTPLVSTPSSDIGSNSINHPTYLA